MSTKHPAEVLADDLDRMWEQLDPVDDWRPVIDASGEMLRRIPALEAERDALRAEVEQWQRSFLDQPAVTEQFRAEVERLTTERDDAIRQQAGALDLVSRIRFALGDNGRRMQPELIAYCRDLREQAAQRNKA